MKPLLLGMGVLWAELTACSNCQAQAHWLTPQGRRQLGQEVPSGMAATAPDTSQAKEYRISHCRLVAYTVAYFDTVATWAQSRIVDAVSYQPIPGASIQVSFSCFGSASLCQVKTAVTDSAGFFRLGWVGCAGPAGGRAPRPLQIRATGYPVLRTQEVTFGGLAYLHTELAPARKALAQPARR